MMRHGLLLGLCFAVIAVSKSAPTTCPESPVSADADTDLDVLLKQWADNAGGCEGVITFTEPNVVYPVATYDEYSMNGDDWTLDATSTC